jgi:hypothetical protein
MRRSGHDLDADSEAELVAELKRLAAEPLVM